MPASFFPNVRLRVSRLAAEFSYGLTMTISTEPAAARHTEHDSSHFVQFYESDVELIEDVGAFLQRALDAGGSAIAIATADHVASLTSWLDSADTATRRAHDAVFVDAHAALDGFMVDGWPDEARFMSTVGALVARTVRAGQPVHAFGEMVAILYAQGLGEAALHLEDLWNGLAREHRFSLFCAYPDRAFTGAEHTPLFRHICDAHQHVLLTRALRDAGDQNLHLRLALAQQRATSLEDEMRRRRSAELQRDAVLMNSPIASALLLGSRHTFQLTNPRYLAMVGRADLINLAYLDAFPEEEGGAIVAALQRVFADGVPIVHEEYRANRTGDERVYTLHFEPLRASSGNVDGVILSAVEVTGYVRAREAVEKSRIEREALLADLRNANGAKDRFLAMLGHELRNPLAPISTALVLVRKQNGGTTDKHYDIIERQVAHLSRLVEDLLDVSRITRGAIELAREPVPIATVLARAIEAANPLLEQRSQTLSLDLADDGGTVSGDPVRLTQVFGNLLNNAAKFTQTDGRIHVKAVSSTTEIVVSVADNGVGISADLMPRLFSFFEQGETTIDRANGGLGVGLALVKNFVELHGGTVVASSDGPGRGATFTVTLPAASAPTTDRGKQPAAPHPDGNGVGVRVLLVDDNKDGLMAMEAYLVEMGFHVATATDPATALEVAAAFSPAFAILDIGLPGMDGYQLARALRAQQTATPVRVFALTGYGQAEDRRRSNDAGFEQHFVKPVALAELVEALTRASPGERPSV
ncbi:Sensor histidine kinase RcsC [Paraburkholderia fynbosensis]|uniref:histidine kinase n=2 Tax=Paraburkholderia fynbosensis TaxID=1200993 RepID=A0A6J5GVM5_9BURK|nr:Sensor histidine kinase RcsC [Paraburkholderia fynbosensis]